jgi:hypothetical protein
MGSGKSSHPGIRRVQATAQMRDHRSRIATDTWGTKSGTPRFGVGTKVWRLQCPLAFAEVACKIRWSQSQI